MIPSIDLVHLAWTQVWQVSLLILIVGGLSHKISRKRPHLAFVLWTLVIVKCLMPPIWSSPTGLFSWVQLENRDPAAVVAPATPLLVAVPDSAAPVPESTASPTTGPADATEGDTIAPSLSPGGGTVSFSLWAAILVIWLTGATLLTGLAVVGWRQCRRVLRSSRLPTLPSVESLAAQVARRIGLRQEAEIVVTSERTAPCVFGVLRPVIVLPENLLRDRPSEDLEPILAHELVHLRRGDALFSLLQMAAQIVWWFHPLVWWANRQATRVTENCCDVEVLTALGCQPATYAKCLLDVLDGGRPMTPACPGLRPAEVTSRRLEDIMRLVRPFNRSTRLWCLAIAIVAAVVVLPGARLVVGWTKEASTNGSFSDGPSSMITTPASPERSILTDNRRPAQRARLLPSDTPLDPAIQGEYIRFTTFVQDGALIACAKYGGDVELRDARSGDLKSTLGVRKYPLAICGAIADRTLAVLAGSKPAELQFWDLSAGTLKDTVPLETGDKRISSANFASDGTAVILNEDDTFSVWDTRTGELRFRYKPQVTPEFIAANVQRLNDAHAKWKARHPEEAAESPVPVNENLTPDDCRINVGEVALSPDGVLAAIAIFLCDERNRGIHCAIQLWDVPTGKLKHTLGHGNRGAYSMCFSNSGRVLGVGESGSVAVWDVPSGVLLQRMESDEMSVFEIAFSPDERRLVGCGNGHRKDYGNRAATIGETKIWDRRTGEVTHAIAGGNGRGNSVEFSPDGKWLVRSDGSTVLTQHTTDEQDHWLEPCGIWGDTVHEACRQVVMVAK